MRSPFISASLAILVLIGNQIFTTNLMFAAFAIAIFAAVAGDVV
jgi:hypothetical protein